MEEPSPEDRLKAIRGSRSQAGAGFRALVIQQTWLWRVSGLILGLLLALLIASLTLTPMPITRHMTTGIDKVYHAIAFAALIFPLILTDSRRWIWAVPLTIAYGGAIELIQPTVGRTAEWLDFGADITGVLAGAALAEILHDRIRDRFFAVDGNPDDYDDDDAEAERMEAMRSELMDELRVVLREELTHLGTDEPGEDAVSVESPVPQVHPLHPTEAGPTRSAGSGAATDGDEDAQPDADGTREAEIRQFRP